MWTHFYFPCLCPEILPILPWFVFIFILWKEWKMKMKIDFFEESQKIYRKIKMGSHQFSILYFGNCKLYRPYECAIGTCRNFLPEFLLIWFIKFFWTKLHVLFYLHLFSKNRTPSSRSVHLTNKHFTLNIFIGSSDENVNYLLKEKFCYTGQFSTLDLWVPTFWALQCFLHEFLKCFVTTSRCIV